jgi:hypothetical protein
MSHLLKIFLGLTLILASERPLLARDASWLVLGGTAGTRTGAIPRAGVDASLLFGKCQDSCGGFGPTLGIINPTSQEYFVGAAAGVAYFGSAWIDGTLRFKENKPTAVAVSYGLGFLLMGYLGGGIDFESKKPFGEIGVTLKGPIEL